MFVFRLGLDGNFQLEAMEDRSITWSYMDSLFWKYRLPNMAFGIDEFMEQCERADPNNFALFWEPTFEQRQAIYHKLNALDENVRRMNAGGATGNQIIEYELTQYREIIDEILLPVQKQHILDFFRTKRTRELGPAGVFVHVAEGKHQQLLEEIRNEVQGLERGLLVIEQEVLERLIDAMPGEVPHKLRDVLGARPGCLRPSVCLMEFNARIRERSKPKVYQQPPQQEHDENNATPGRTGPAFGPGGSP